MQSFRHAQAAAVLFVALLTLLAGAHAAGAAVAPEVLVSVGSTFAVTGQPGSGGACVSAGLLYPFEGRFAFGVVLFADDLGTGSVELKDPNSGIPLGTVGGAHRWSFGGEWRTEVRVRESRRTRVLWEVGYGYGRQESDQRGELIDAVSGVLVSTGATFLWRASHGHAFGATLAYKRAFVNNSSDPERATSWATAAFEWRWQGAPRE